MCVNISGMATYIFNVLLFYTLPYPILEKLYQTILYIVSVTSPMSIHPRIKYRLPNVVFTKERASESFYTYKVVLNITRVISLKICL